jgi:hypothetical protein
MASTGEWGQRLATPDLSVAAPLFFDGSGQPLPPNPTSNVMPPDGQVFTHILEKHDQVIVTTIERNPDTLHPYARHHTVGVGMFAGRAVLGSRVRFFHGADTPVMDLAGEDGRPVEGAFIKLVVGDDDTLRHIYMREAPSSRPGVPVSKQVRGLVGTGYLYKVALMLLDLPLLPEDAQRRLDSIAARTAELRAAELAAGKSDAPRGRKSE